MTKYRVYGLRVNNQRTPITVTYPVTFTWKLISGKQKRYFLEISTDSDFTTLVLNIEKFTSNTKFVLKDKMLDWNTKYYVRVRSLNNKDELSEWSTVHTFELPVVEWSAKWIRPKKQNNPDHPFLTKYNFKTTAPIEKARLYITAQGVYQASLNGNRVGNDYFRPGFTDYNHRLQYQQYDITNLLQNENEIQVLVADGWFTGYYGWDQSKDKFGHRTALLAQLQIEYINGEKVTIGTNENWKFFDNPIQSADIYNGETIDYRVRNAIIGNGEMTVINYPNKKLVPQEGPSVHQITTLHPQKVLKSTPNETILDMGQNMVGWVRVKVHGNKGQKVITRYAEIMVKHKDFYTDNLRNAKAMDTYLLDDDTEVIEPHFTYHGFRCVQIKGLGYELNSEDVEGIVLSSKMQVTGSFKTDNEKLNRLEKNIEWSLKANFFDIPTDCPQRDERLGWTGDAQIFAPTASFLVNTQGFFKKWLKDVALDQADQGGAVPLVVPDVLKGMLSDGQMNTTTGWGDVATFVPWTLYKIYDDKEILVNQYDSMKSWVDYMMSRGDNPYLWDTDIQLGDWLALDSPHKGADPVFGATSTALVATAFFAESTRVLASAAKVLGNMSDYLFYHSAYEKIVEAFQSHFLDANYTLVSNTQTANTLALKFNLLDGQAKQVAIQNLVNMIYNNNDHIVTGFLGTPYVCEVLADNGYQDLAFKLLFNEDYPSWLYQVNHDGPTIWERWNSVMDDYTMNPDGMNSLNHYAYGAIGNFLYRYLGGIRLRKPGYKESIIYPVLPKNNKVNHVAIQFNSENGLIQNTWTRKGYQFQMDTIVPDNTEAIIVLPTPADKKDLLNKLQMKYPKMIVGLTDKSTTEFMGEKYPLGPDSERSLTVFGADAVVITVTGGTYNFEYQLG
ncbi:MULTISPECIES: alpha-L-rhamnosidase [Lactiplantibacillus]|uniref:alpha-L-rhamnosidase n=1 Tax=Lactiplantibacillus TaxID=2767842 RepID=UPI002076F536|nr:MULTISPECIES: alpha-L-rhamnosidase [Lactiplantibacillus]MCM8608541.1 glycoside hydrolase family 78 protein [Lactiplantibacillus sp. B652]